jgi:hypothetical protein
VEELNSAKLEEGVDVVVAPPSLYIGQVILFLTDRIEVAGQNSWVGKAKSVGSTAESKVKQGASEADSAGSSIADKAEYLPAVETKAPEVPIEDEKTAEVVLVVEENEASSPMPKASIPEVEKKAIPTSPEEGITASGEENPTEAEAVPAVVERELPSAIEEEVAANVEEPTGVATLASKAPSDEEITAESVQEASEAPIEEARSIEIPPEVPEA